MARNGMVGRVATVWRFPVKSLRGERIDRAQILSNGILGDRAYALVDAETGEVVSAKNIRRFPGIFGLRATFAAGPDAGAASPPVRIELPDGRRVRSDSEDAEALISSHLGREVRLVRMDVREGEPGGNGGPFHDASPLSVLTNSTLGRMNELQPGSVFDARRFRMNLILDCEAAGFPENEWVGRSLKIGHEARLVVTRPDARCVMTTLAQDELPEDRAILTGLARHNRLQVGDKGRYPCAGVYARVACAGAVAVGDPVVLEEA